MSTEDSQPLVATESKDVTFKLADALREGADVFDKSYGQMVMEIARSSFGDGMLTAEEYFWHRLPSLDLDAEELGQFAGRKRAASTNFLCNNMRWVAICADKVIFVATLSAMGFPVPEAAAFVHNSRPHRSLPLLRTPNDVAEWLRSDAPYPIFGKPLGGMQSIGAASLAGYHADTDELEDLFGRRFPLQQMVGELGRFFDDGYMFQKRLNPHPDIAERCGPALSTLRVLCMHDEEGPEIMDVAFKMTVHGQVADNFWRGNLLGGVRLEDGKVERVVTRAGTSGKRLAEHPEAHRRHEPAKRHRPGQPKCYQLGTRGRSPCDHSW